MTRLIPMPDIQLRHIPPEAGQHFRPSHVSLTQHWRLQPIGQIAPRPQENEGVPRFELYNVTVVELTIEQVLSDPMIKLVNQADGVNKRSFAQLLQSASRVLERRAK